MKRVKIRRMNEEKKEDRKGERYGKRQRVSRKKHTVDVLSVLSHFLK